MRHAALIALLIFGSAGSVWGGSPAAWSPVIVATGDYRTKIRSTPIQHRPGRPLHVYGNTIRLFNQSGRAERTRPLQHIVFGTSNFGSGRNGR